MIQIIAFNLLFGVYIAVRLYRGLFFKINKYIAVPVIFILTELFVLLKLLERFIGFVSPIWLINLSYILLGVSVYLFLYFFLFDILWLVRIRPGLIFKGKMRLAVIVMVFAFATFSYGYYHHLQTKVTEYSLTFDKPLLKDMRVLMISDIHIGSGMSASRLAENIEMANSLNPDIVILAGDIIDSDIKAFTEPYRAELRKFNAPLGVYGILGNHEYYSGDINEIITAFKGSGMTLLKDEVVYFDDYGFYLLGRDSIRHSKSKGDERIPISELTKMILDKSRPLIIADHVPQTPADGIVAGAQLQLSGHTHGGQFFPITLMVDFIYDNSYGLLKTGGFNMIVSSGLGLWGPPMRVGSDSEMVIINIKAQ